MLPSFARQGAPIRSFHPSTYGLVLVTFLSLLFIIFPSRSAGPETLSAQSILVHEQSPQAEVDRTYPQIVVLGDSIAERSFDEAEGYGIKLTSMYAGKMDVLNRGYAGYNSRQLLRKLKEDMVLGDVRLFLIHVGTNDAMITGEQKVEGDDYQKNVFAILDHISERYPAARVLCVTPSTLQPDWWLAHMRNTRVSAGEGGSTQELTESDRTIASNKRYTHLLKSIVREWNKVRADVRDGNERGNGKKVAIVDAFRAHAIAKGQHGVTNEQLFTDGLHWSSKGYMIVTREITKMLPVFEDLIPGKLPYAYDHWSKYRA